MITNPLLRKKLLHLLIELDRLAEEVEKTERLAERLGVRIGVLDYIEKARGRIGELLGVYP